MGDRSTRSSVGILLMAFVLPGLGHFFLGRKIVGLLLSLSTLVLGVGAAVYFFDPSIKVSSLIIVPLVIIGMLFSFSLGHAFYLVRSAAASDGKYTAISLKGVLVLIAGFACIILLYCFGAVLIAKNFCGSFVVPPYAMEPTIYNGERVLVNKTAYKSSLPKRGDVIVYQYPKDPQKLYMHRVIAFPGESVELKDHKIVINGVKIVEDWALKVRHYNGGKLAKRGMKPIVVPPDSYYVLGDNAARSEDSRAWGFLPKKNVVGKVYKIYYPFNRSGSVK